MIVLLIILLMVLAIFIALCLLKIRFLIDTEEGVFQVSQGLLYRVQAFTDVENPAKLKIRILGIPFVLDLFKTGKENKITERPEQIKKTKRKRKGRIFGTGNIVKAIVKALNIKYLYTSLDSEDFAFNAQLFPSIYLLNQKFDDRYWFEINFIGENYFKMQMESRPIWVVIAFVKLRYNQIKTKKNGI